MGGGEAHFSPFNLGGEVWNRPTILTPKDSKKIAITKTSEQWAELKVESFSEF